VKRKVKFQEGGAVPQTANEMSAEQRQRLRNIQLREMMEKSGREGKRVGLAERARQREAANQAARRATAADRAAVERLNPGQGAAEAERRAGRAVPERRPDFTTDPRGTTRPGADTGREMVRSREAMPRPSASRALAEVATPRQMPLGRVRPPVGGLPAVAGAVAAEALGPVVNYGREYAARQGAEADARREANLEAFRNQQRDMQTGDVPGNQASGRPSPDAVARMAEIDAQGRDVPGNRAMSPPPRPRPRPAPAPAPRRELTMEEIRALQSGERAPRTSEERALREGLRMSEADRLNEREYQRILAARAAEEEAARQMGGSGDIGAASARARGEQVGPPGDYNMKKGGVVKKKAGGMIAAKPKAAPKKMMKGGMIAKPKVAAKSKTKPMPFKKGGVIKKGRK